MSTNDLIYDVLGVLPQGAPGNDASTLRTLEAVPNHGTLRQVLDLGVGHGRTTLTLARSLPHAEVTAVDVHPPFVEKVAAKARKSGLAKRVRAVCGKMEEMDVAQGSVDLVWAEGSIYVIGVRQALALWRSWLRPSGCVAFSDLAWWTDDPSKEAREFWAAEYPDMMSEARIRSLSESEGYRVIDCFRMPKEAHDAYYIPMEARLADYTGQIDGEVTELLRALRKEIDMVRKFSTEAGYTFFVLQLPGVAP